MIDQATIDRIVDAAQIVDVVSEFVTLKRRGINYTGLCPFHNEKTPSFSVSPSKGLCKCFSCGKGGNAVHFIMEHEQLSYYEALKFLARKYNIEVKERELSSEEKQAQSVRESMFVVNNFANEYFQTILHNHIDGKSIGMAYFRERGFTDSIIKKFQLGFSTEQRDALAQEAKKKGYKEEFLTKTGLCYSTDDGRIRDRFWGRVIFPVHTLSGKVVAFGGRILRSDTKTAKYVNSPESDIYHKSNELYGIYFAKQAIVKQDRCFLVEGYTDVISMHQAGLENVVSSSGTALTPGQIRLIHRFTNNITVLYDGDKAGIKASIRGIDMLLEEGMNIKVVLLPEGEDPDSFAKKHNATEFQNYIEQHQVDFIRFKTNLLLEEAGKDPIKRAELITDIVKSITVIPEAIVRTVYIKECAHLLKVDEKVLDAEIAKRIEVQVEKNFTRAKEEEKKAISEGNLVPSTQDYISYIPQQNQYDTEFYLKEKLILRILVRYGERVMLHAENEDGETVPVTVMEYIINDLQNDELSFYNPLHRQMLEEAAQQIGKETFIAERHFLTHPSLEISTYAAELAGERYFLSRSQAQGHIRDEERLHEIVPRLMVDFKSTIIKEEMKHILNTLKEPDIIKDEERYAELMRRYQELCLVQREMVRHQGDRIIFPER